MSLSSFPFSCARPGPGGEQPRQEHQRPALESLLHGLDGVPRTAPEPESFAPHSILSPRLASPSSVLPLNTVALYSSTLAREKNAPRGPEVAVP